MWCYCKTSFSFSCIHQAFILYLCKNQIVNNFRSLNALLSILLFQLKYTIWLRINKINFHGIRYIFLRKEFFFYFISIRMSFASYFIPFHIRKTNFPCNFLAHRNKYSNKYFDEFNPNLSLMILWNVWKFEADWKFRRISNSWVCFCLPKFFSLWGVVFICDTWIFHCN